MNEIDEMNMETTDAFAAYLTEGSDRQMDFPIVYPLVFTSSAILPV